MSTITQKFHFIKVLAFSSENTRQLSSPSNLPPGALPFDSTRGAVPDSHVGTFALALKQ